MNFIKEYIFNNKLLSIYLFMFLVSIVLVFLKVEIFTYSLFVLLGFGWSVFFLGKRINILEHLFISPLIFSALFVTYISLFAMLNIKLDLFCFIAFAIVSIVIFLSCGIFKEVNFKVNKWDWLVFVIFILAIFAKVYSLKDFNASPLHDPISHSYYSRQIVNTGLIEYFYSPGLHIMAAFGEMSGGFDVVKQILYLSNFYGVCLATVSYIFIKYFFNNKIWGLFTALLFGLGYYPILFFFNAGKNALVMALSILILLAYIVTLNIRLRDKKLYALANIVLASMFLVHYPSAVFGCTFVAAVFVVYFKELKWEGVLNGLGAFLGIAWLASTYKYQLASVENSFKQDSENFSYVSKAEDIWGSFLFYIKSIWNSVKPRLKPIEELPKLGGLLGIPFLLVDYVLKSRKKLVLIIVWLFIQFVVFGLITVLHVSSLSVVFETFLLSLGLYYYILCGYLAYKIYFFVKKVVKGKFVEILLIIAVSIVSGIATYYMYRACNIVVYRADVVRDPDYEAFLWIDKNIPDEKAVLINAMGGDGLVFSSDAGGWLEIYTGNKISMPFYRYGEIATNENIQIYYLLRDDINNCNYTQQFIDRGYEYYYQGSYPYYDRQLFDPNETDVSKNFELVYEKDGAALYKLVSCY